MLTKTRPQSEKLSAGTFLSLGATAVQMLFDGQAGLRLLRKIGALDGDRIAIGSGPKTYLFLKHPADIEQVMMARTDVIGHSRYQSNGVGIRNNERVITNSHGEAWAQQRRNLAGFMGKNGLKSGFTPEAEQEISAHLDGLQDQSLIAVETEATSFALKYGLRAMFDYSATNQECEEMRQGAEALHRYLLASVSTLNKLPKPWIKKFSRVHLSTDASDQIIGRLVKAYQSASADVQEKHLFTRILPEELRAAFTLPPQGFVRAAVNEMIVASHLSVRTSFYWAMHHLARHPEVQEQIAADSRAAGGKVSFRPDRDGNMPEVAKVALETLRLHPALYFILKEAKEDFIGEDGLTIRAGTTVLISPWLTHRDQRYYDNPEAFAPDEHFAPHVMRNREKGAYIPFGHGPHNCPGSGMTLQEMSSTLSELCTRFKLETLPGQEELPPEYADVFLHPEQNSHLKITPR